MKKNIIFFLLFSSIVFSQKNKLEIIDIGSKELKFLDKYYNKNIDSAKLIQKIYTPYRELWEGYVGSESDFLKWVNSKQIEDINQWKSNDKVNSKKLASELKKYADKMYLLTGKKPMGKWFFIYGPSWTNLGGLGSGEMLIDLAHPKNTDNENIIFVYPHELNHQIYNIENLNSDFAVLNRIIDEGFGTYINYIYHDKKFSKAQELYYTEEEFDYCEKNEKVLIDLLNKYYKSNDEEIASKLAGRRYKIGDNFPGAIAYYLGFRIIEEYVKQNGGNSWKDIYDMQPMEVLEKSKILEKYK